MPLVLGAALLAALVAVRARLGVDYEVDGRPSILALSDLDLAAFADQQPAMGPLSILLRAPFAALSDALGLGLVGEYRLGAAACLFPAALIALVLARRLVLRTGRLELGLVLGALLIVNPLVFNALNTGHPEEVLAGALAVAAVVLAAEGRAVWAVVLLAAAVATKQPALVAVGPVLFALAPPARRTAALVLAGGALLLLAPFLLVDPDAFFAMNEKLLRGSVDALPFTPWWLVADGSENIRVVGDWVAPLGRVVTVFAPLLAAALLARASATRTLGADRALALLAAGALVRCLLDPADNPYYHVPALLALAVWETEHRRAMPWLTIASTAILWFLVIGPWRHGDPDLVAALYLAWFVPLTAGLIAWLARSARRDRPSPV